MKVKKPRFADDNQLTSIHNEARHQSERDKENADHLHNRFNSCNHAAQKNSERVSKQGIPEAQLPKDEHHLCAAIHMEEVIILVSGVIR